MFHRIKKTSNFTVISNSYVHDNSLSLKARGLLIFILTLPDDWVFNINGLCKACGTKEDAVKSGLKELKDAGYIRVNKLKPSETKSKKIEYVYEIYEVPIKENQEEKKQEVKSGKDVDNSVENSKNIISISQYLAKNNATEKQGTELKHVGSQAVGEPSIYINTNKSNTYQQNTYLQSTYLSILKDSIDYDVLIHDRPTESGIIHEILTIMFDVVTSQKPTIKIAGEEKPAEVVKAVFLKLDKSHIEYVLMSLESTTTEIRNIKAYLITALYNAPLTINNYYRQRVNHDFG